MSAAETDHVCDTGLTTVERKAFAHDMDRQHLAGCEVAAEMHRLPEFAQQLAAGGPRPGRGKIDGRFFLGDASNGGGHGYLANVYR